MFNPHSETCNPKSSLWLHRYVKLLVMATFILIAAGGSVTTTGSGLAVPDWPLSYGMLMPPMVGGVFYEHLHRMIAATVGLMTLFLTIWVGFVEKRIWMRWLTIGAFGAVVVQGILGGLTVLYLLPAPISIFHACLAQTFFTLIVCIAVFTSNEWRMRAGRSQAYQCDGFLKKILVVTAALVYVQLILGATVRHTENRFVLVSHILGAFLVLIHVALLTFYVLRKYESNKELLRPTVVLAIVFCLQMGLGMGAFVYTVALKHKVNLYRGQLFFVTAHQTVGALLLAICAFLMLKAFRRVSE